MSPFLDGVRVFHVQSPSLVWRTDSDTTLPEGAKSYLGSPSPSPSASPARHHSSDSGDIPVFAVPITAIVCTFIYLTIKAIVAPFRERSRFNRAHAQVHPGGGGLSPEEVAVLQKLQRTLTQMESRVESLETIIIEQARSEKNYGSKL